MKTIKTIKTLQQIQEEIKNYPTPVAPCDTHFNFLLSERDRLTKESAVGKGRRIIMEEEIAIGSVDYEDEQ